MATDIIVKIEKKSRCLRNGCVT